MAKQATQKNIRHLSKADIEEYFENIGEKKFRANQVYEWLWLKPVQSFDEMTNISKDLRNKLKEEFTLPALTVDTIQHSELGRPYDSHLLRNWVDF